ncbi:cytochrome P450 3A24-like [Rhineura floridana]|uniref:cytochrome P450 3A24-like n=1 Tax=Rhineura floridana TaxID=261503 RepID=UPI002AC814D3|nr:cytochrome P450 3A24-like [Rhineura floridana]
MALLLLPSFPLETWILALGFLALFLLYGIWPYSFFKNLGIPGPRPLPFIGTFHKYSKGIVHFDQSCYQKYGKIWGIFDGRQPVMAILDPTIIKTILVKEFYTNFTNHRDFILNGDLDTAITIAPNEQWKRIRTVLSPTFTSGRLKEMLPIINRYGEMLVKNVQKKVDNGKPIAMKEIFSAYSMDVVTSTSFSINIDSMNSPNDPLVVHIKRLVRFNFLSPVLILAALFPLLTPVLNMLNISIMPPSLVNFLFDVVKKIKEHRQKNDHMHRADFLQLMLDSQISGDTSDEANSLTALTDKEILTQAIVFISAGYKTKGSTLSFLSYCLATHPDVQQKLQEEIDEALPNQAPTYEAVVQLEYLDMVVNETLRLYPPGGRIERVCKNTIEINGVTIPKGTVTMIPAFVLHHDPEYWPEPKEYRPERFSKESREAIDPYVFLPFGAGPRNCIGMHFALLVLKVAVVVLLQKFSFRPCKETQIPMELDSKGFFMQPKKPIKVKLVPRGIADSKE